VHEQRRRPVSRGAAARASVLQPRPEAGRHPTFSGPPTRSRRRDQRHSPTPLHSHLTSSMSGSTVPKAPVSRGLHFPVPQDASGRSRRPDFQGHAPLPPAEQATGPRAGARRGNRATTPDPPAAVNTFRREPDGADRSSDQQQQVGAGLTGRRPDKAVETDTDRRHRPGACGVVGHTSDAVSGGNGGRPGVVPTTDDVDERNSSERRFAVARLGRLPRATPDLQQGRDLRPKHPA
jgi:hypothetical protein